MPTPKRKLQPLLKPILKRRPKAAFKQRTMIEVLSRDDVNFKKPKQPSLMNLHQMLGTETEPGALGDKPTLIPPPKDSVGVSLEVTPSQSWKSAKPVCQKNSRARSARARCSPKAKILA